MSKSYVYARNKDGSLSRCQAKDPSHCPYHVGLTHMTMTEREARAVNEAAIQAGTTVKRLSKNGVYDVPNDKYNDLVVSITEEQADDIYNKAMETINKIESDVRSPLASLDDYAPEPDDLASDISEREKGEMESIKSTDGGDADINGHPLLGNEESMLISRLKDYNNSDIKDYEDRSRISPSPMQERLLDTLVQAPNVSDETMDSLAHDDYTMQYGASRLINSTHASRKNMEDVWTIAPASALEAQRLPGDLVDATLKQDSTPLGLNHGEYIRQTNPGEDPVRAINNALRHPHGSPEVGYETMRRIMNDDQWTESEKTEFAWSQCLNPNDDYRREIARLDSKNSIADQLPVTREWIADHGGV